jgi:DNA-binding LytR/AlgR family response regulator
MKVLIIEDEELAVKKLQKTLLAVDPQAEITGITGSIQETVNWFRENPTPDIILMDIELADGQSFEIFNQTEILCPVIFTTSYDEYTLKAFKVNSVDYLLKPVQKEELEAALSKFKRLKEGGKGNISIDYLVRELKQKLQPREYRKRFLVKLGQKLVSVDVEEICFFYSDGRINFFKTRDNKKYVVDYTMDELEEMLDPSIYFRISRSFFVSVSCIEKMDDYFGHRLILNLKPVSEKEAIVSREKVSDFKKWMGK